MPPRAEWTLSAAARLLHEPQHRLIYLCEKGVVIPDYGDAAGRGSSRRFSARNLLEFALALQLRKLTISAATVAGVLYVLRGVEKLVAEQWAGFGLVTGLRARSAPALRLIINDGERLYFQLGAKHAAAKLFGGVDFQLLATGRKRRVTATELQLVPAEAVPAGCRYARIEVDVTRLAQDLPLAG